MSDQPAAETRSDSWGGTATGAGLALAIVAALALLGVLAQGFAVEQDTGLGYKLGIAFLRNLDATPIGLMALVVVALVAAPTLAGVPLEPGQRRNGGAALTIVLLVCLVVIFGTVLGVVTRLHFDQGPGQAITSATRRVLATFVVRSMGPALVAFGAALAVLPRRLPRPVTAAPYADGGGTGADDPEPGPGTGTP